MSFQEVQQRIKLREGLELKPYRCTSGKLSIGRGRNLDDIGISEDEADYLFRNDFKRAKQGAETFVVYEHLDRVRRGVLIEMVFQLGIASVYRFKKFLSAALRKDWDEAANQMLDSKWHEQTPERCEDLAEIFRRGDA